MTNQALCKVLVQVSSPFFYEPLFGHTLQVSSDFCLPFQSLNCTLDEQKLSLNMTQFVDLFLCSQSSLYDEDIPGILLRYPLEGFSCMV